MVGVIIFWLLFSLVVGVMASHRGRGGYGWFLLACLISPLLAFLFLVASPNLAESAAVRAPTEKSHVRCPACAELVLPEAVKCKHCGATLVPDRGFHQRHVTAVAAAAKGDNKNLAVGIGFIVFLIVVAWMIDGWG